MKTGLRNIVAVACLSVIHIGGAQAQEKYFDFNIQENAANITLGIIAKESKTSLLLPYDTVKSIQANSVKGTFSLQKALDLALANTGLIASINEDKVIIVTFIDPKRNSTEEKKMKKLKIAKNMLLGGAAIASALTATTVNAQDNATKDAPKSGVAALLEEIVVVGRKKNKSESLQSIPTSVSAFNETTMDAHFTTDLSDIGKMVPNVELNHLGTFPGNQSFYIRGMGVNSSIPTEDPATGVFVDGMYLGVNASAMLDTFDMEAIEVLRGPQGTLFGRNVTGGAINIRSARPSGEFGVKAKATIGSAKRRDFALAIEGPLVKDKVNAKLSFLSRKRDGYVKNINPDFPGDTLGEIDSFVIRSILEFKPSDTFDFTLIGEYGEDNGDAGATTNQPDAAKLASIVYGYTPPENLYEASQGGANSTVGTPELGAIDFDHKHLIGEANWDVGNGVITSVTGYREVNQQSATDFDGTPHVIFHFSDVRLNQDQFSEELRYASSFSDKFDFTVGLYYFEQTIKYKERRHLLEIIYGTGLESAGNAVQDSKTYGIFGQGDYHISDKLTLTLGARYTSEQKNIHTAPIGTCNLDFTCDAAVYVDADKTWKNFTPKVGLSYQVTDDNLLYASWTKGFRSGGFNARPQSAVNVGPYDEESVNSFEAGSKNTLMGGRARINLAGFVNKYKGLQRQVTIPGAGVVQGTLNAADATNWGLEGEFQILPVDNFVLSGSIGYLNASYDSFDNFDLSGDGIPDPTLAAALEFERVPKLTYNITAAYDLALADLGMLTLRSSYNFKDKWFGDVRNSPTALHPSTKLLDASVTFADSSERWSVSFAGKNLTNEEYFSWIVPAGTLSLNGWGQTPRTWMLEVKFTY